ncbi:MAG: hypothetical protein SWE60_15205 [Thermodesulfobacteriota bacterium]|nr:hypothetical protein [Thermodesulfobacteriota bacterium]
MSVMAFDQKKKAHTLWALALTAMGVFLCVKTPYALRHTSDTSFLSFARYVIAALLVLGGVKKLYSLYFSKNEESSHEE